MKKNIALAAIFILLGVAPKLHAQSDRTPGIIWSYLNGLEYQVRAGVNIGGTSPMPLPKEIRSIEGYSPTLCISLEGNVLKWIDKDKKYGVILGLRLENKGMKTRAEVKNYSMEIIDGNSSVKGNWTGGVKTNFSGSYLSIPLLAAFNVAPRVKLSVGPYFSFMTDGEFSGRVLDGYLRKGDPTGTKVEFKDGKEAVYDFSENLKTFQIGAQAGAEWRAFKHLNVYADLTWGLSNIFEKEFKTISFKMYPIYLNVGFGYAF